MSGKEIDVQVPSPRPIPTLRRPILNPFPVLRVSARTVYPPPLDRWRNRAKKSIQRFFFFFLNNKITKNRKKKKKFFFSWKKCLLKDLRHHRHLNVSVVKKPRQNSFQQRQNSFQRRPARSQPAMAAKRKKWKARDRHQPLLFIRITVTHCPLRKNLI